MIPPPRPNFQNTNTPDINLERDLVPDAEVLLGIESANITEELEPRNKKLTPDIRFKINLSTIIISALIFLMILAWFDFMQTTFFSWINPVENPFDVTPSSKLWYAVLVSVVVIVLVLLIYYYSKDYIAA